MARRRCLLVAMAVVVSALTPRLAAAQAPGADKAKVLALSKRIDALIAARWKEAGLKPAPRADDSTYFRRLNLDLAGRIPTLTDHRDFLDDDHPEKRWHWVDNLLAAETYARHFARFWRTQMLGTSTNQQFAFVSPGFELWLEERLKRNSPYDRIVHEIISSAAPNGNMYYGVPTGNPAAFYALNEYKPENLASATSRVFLGVKLECAQCHAHPFAKWTREQFWEFAAFYSDLQRFVPQPNGGPPVPPAQRQIKIPGTDKVVKARFLTGKQPEWKDNDQTRTVLADWITSRDNPYFARAAVDHVWQYFFGVSLLEPILEPSDDTPVTHEQLLDELARQFIEHGFDLKFLIRAIVHSEAYQRASTGETTPNKEDYWFFTRMPVRGLTPEQLFDSVAEATAYKDPTPQFNPNQPFNPLAQATPRAQFLARFTTQDRRHETQTSILQALFMMNGKFLAERLKVENNESLRVLATVPQPTAKKIDTLFVWVLSRQPRPEESARLARYVDSGGPTGNHAQALADVYWALLNSAEFMLNH